MWTLGLFGRLGLIRPGVAVLCVRLNVWPAIARMAVLLVVVVFAAAVSVTVRLAVPLVGVTVIQAGTPVTVHPHPAADVTATEVVPPVPLTVPLAGEIAKVHAGAAACVTVTVWPAIVPVPVRLVAAVFGPAVTVTLPLPVPFVGLRVNHVAARATPADAVQLHPAAVVTVSADEPPAAGSGALVGATV
jgi:hypothetical protein